MRSTIKCIVGFVCLGLIVPAVLAQDITSPDGMWRATIDNFGQISNFFTPDQPNTDNVFESLYYEASSHNNQQTRRVENFYTVISSQILPNSANFRLEKSNFPLSLDASIAMIDGVNGGAIVTMRYTNNDPQGSSVSVKPFYYIDIDISGTFGDDGAGFLPGPPSFIEQSDAPWPGGTKPLLFGGFGPYKSWEIDQFPVLRTALDAGRDQLFNQANFPGPLDLAAALSGEKILLQPGENVVLTVGIGRIPEPATGTPNSLTTLFADNNSGSPGGGVYFDVTVGADPIEIISFEVNSTAVVGTSIAFEAYTHVGGASTFENSPAGWTLVATGSGSAAGQGIPTPVTLNAPFVLPANTTLGMALTLGPAAGHAYTNGDGTNQHYADANVALDLGQANNAIFGPGLFSPRVWNGTITYNVVLPPTILTQPTSIARCTGASATFQVVASGTGTLSYQWQQDGVAIPGATGDSFTKASVTLADAGSYDVVVTNNFGTVTSDAATLSVCPGPGDMNGDGLVNAADTALFVAALLAG